MVEEAAAVDVVEEDTMMDTEVAEEATAAVEDTVAVEATAAVEATEVVAADTIEGVMMIGMLVVVFLLDDTSMCEKNVDAKVSFLFWSLVLQWLRRRRWRWVSNFEPFISPCWLFSSNSFSQHLHELVLRIKLR